MCVHWKMSKNRLPISRPRVSYVSVINQTKFANIHTHTHTKRRNVFLKVGSNQINGLLRFAREKKRAKINLTMRMMTVCFTRRKDLRMDSPLTLASPSSTRLKTTMTMSKQFQRSCRYVYRPRANTFSTASAVKMAVNTCRNTHKRTALDSRVWS